MKKYILLISMMALIAGCSNEETADTSSENEDSEEVARLKEENEELKRQQAEQEKETEQQEQENDASEDKSDTESESQESKQENESDENEQQDDSALTFDINSDEVKNQMLGTSGATQKGEFIQDAIQIGMSQSEVEELHGSYDFIQPSAASIFAIYGNLAVHYSGGSAHGDGSDGSITSIDPNENYVNLVYYYADVSPEQLINSWGEPDHHEDGTNGPQHYSYFGETDNGKYYSTSAMIEDTPQGKNIGLVSREIFDQKPDVSNQSSSETIEVDEDGRWVTTEPNPDAEIQDEDRYEYLLTEYLQRLTSHYNNPDGFEDVYYYLRRGSAAYDKISANKASGNFTGHKTESVEMTEMTDLGDGTVKLNANRVYSHDNSNGRRIANVDYIVNAETNEIIDFQQVSDEAY